MRIFIIGGTGYVGSHVAARLQALGHELVGFARSEASADQLAARGIAPWRGEIHDRAGLRSQVLAADATVFAARLLEQGDTKQLEYDVVQDLLAALAGTGKAFVFTSGTGVLGQATGGDWSDASFAEDDPFTAPAMLAKRAEAEAMVQRAATAGVRGMVIRPPLIWGNGLPSHGLHVLRSVVEVGAACYIGAGLNVYSGVHVEDLADLYALALERGTAGALYHATNAEVPMRWLAETIASALGVPSRSIALEEASALWGAFNATITMASCSRSRSPRARRELGWSPRRQDALVDIAQRVQAIAADPAECERVLSRRPGASAPAR